MQQQDAIVKLLNVVYTDVQSISGTVSKECNTAGDVFTEGQVRYIEPALLRPFSRARQAATRLLSLHGTRFLNGWAVPDESLPEIRNALAAISTTVSLAKAEFVSKLSTHRLEWELKHPEVTPFRHRFPSDAYIEKSLAMLVSIYKIEPSAISHEELSDGIRAEVSGMAGGILREIAQDVRDSWKPKPGGEPATTRSLGVLERSQLKLERMAFVDAELAEVAVLIGSVLAILPSKGPIKDRDLVTLTGLMNTLSDPDRVVAMARAAAEHSPATLWDDYVDPGSPAALAPAVAVTPESGPVGTVISPDFFAEPMDATTFTTVEAAPAGLPLLFAARQPGQPPAPIYVPPAPEITSGAFDW